MVALLLLKEKYCRDRDRSEGEGATGSALRRLDSKLVSRSTFCDWPGRSRGSILVKVRGMGGLSLGDCDGGNRSEDGQHGAAVLSYESSRVSNSSA